MNANKNEHKRIKHRSRPGDIPKRHKIAMREKKFPIIVSSCQEVTEKGAKSYRSDLKDRSKSVQRQRDKIEIEASFDDYEAQKDVKEALDAVKACLEKVLATHRKKNKRECIVDAGVLGAVCSRSVRDHLISWLQETHGVIAVFKTNADDMSWFELKW